MSALNRSSRTSRLDRARNERIMEQINVKEAAMESIEKKAAYLVPPRSKNGGRQTTEEWVLSENKMRRLPWNKNINE